MAQDSKATWFHRLPKLEIHFHIEGAIPLDAMLDLIRKYGGDPAITDLDSLRNQFRFRDFPHFLELWVWKNGFLREYDDFAFFAKAVAEDLARQNIRYVEAYFSPSRFFADGLSTTGLLEAIRSGLSMVPDVEVALIPDLVRDNGPENAARVLEQLAEVRELGIIGVGMGGAEHLFPAHMFSGVYERARDLGFRTTAHAGEVSGPESVWSAIRSLNVERIGHGTRSEEDPALVEYLREARIPLEMCPLSNVATRAVESIEAHPIRRYFDQGLLVTVNTDDPMMFGNSLVQEYETLTKVFSFTPAEIRQLIQNALEACWMEPARKAQLIESFEANEAWSNLPG